MRRASGSALEGGYDSAVRVKCCRRGTLGVVSAVSAAVAVVAGEVALECWPRSILPASSSCWKRAEACRRRLSTHCRTMEVKASSPKARAGTVADVETRRHIEREGGRRPLENPDHCS